MAILSDGRGADGFPRSGHFSLTPVLLVIALIAVYVEAHFNLGNVSLADA
ncbi:MAG TPA: hypothetical protein VIY49_35405 [Bryobacteraceae bacterium]